MKKTAQALLVIFVIFTLLSVYVVQIDGPQVAAAQAEVKLVEVARRDPGNFLDFKVYFSRSDKDLQQEDYKNSGEMLLTGDLPQELQPRLMYITDAAGSFEHMCDRPRFPHKCEVTLPNNAQTEYEFILKTTFEDGAYSENSITVPYPAPLPEPEIIEPTSVPGQNDTFAIKFKETGADSYDINVRLCEPYNDDGINPCLGGAEYQLTRSTPTEFSVPGGLEADTLSFVVDNGFIKASSGLKLLFSESIVYEVLARKIEEKNGIRFIIENFTSKSFKLN